MRVMTKRILSLLLCLVLVVGLMPATALHAEAATDPVVVIAGSDFQNTNKDHDAGAEVVTGLLEQIRKDYSEVDGFLFAGDYYYDYNDSANGKAKLQETVLSEYPTLSTDNMIWVEGNHDDPKRSQNSDLVKNGTLSASGKHDTDDYGVYVINHRDYMWNNDDETTIKKTATALDAYLDAKAEENYDKPIFVVSHLPLHYSMRTYKDGDGKHANYIFDVLNEAGAKDLNIIFLFGHDHSHGWDDYLGGAAIYLEPGDKINIAQNSTTSYKEETLNFTYMNAGYVAYYGDTGSGADTSLTMTAFEITDGNVKISRYDNSGEHVLKAAGAYGREYPDNKYANPVYSADSNVYKSSRSISWTVTPEETEPTEPETSEPTTEPTEPETPNEVTVGDVTVSVSGATVTDSGEISDADKDLLDAKGYEDYVAIDITATVDGTATVSFPVPSGWDSSHMVGISVENGKVKEIKGSVADGVFSFSVNHFSAKGIALAAETEESGTKPEKWEEIPGESTDIFRLTDSLTSGKKYVIVNNKVAGDASAVNLNGGSINSTSVTIIADSEGNYIVAPATTAQWTYNSSSKFQSVSTTNRYLRGRDDSDPLRTTTNSGNSYTSWTYSASYGLQCLNGWYIPSSITGDMVNASTTNRVYIFEEDVITTVGGYAGMTGQTDYTIAAGTYTNEAQVLELIRSNIKVYTATDANGTDPIETTDYTITGTVNPGKAGEYTGTVKYGNTVIGKFTVTVTPKVLDPDPDYPNPGSIQLGKTATGQNFLDTGLARVELSTSGLPAGQGADVVVVIDTSSSMKDNKVGNSNKTRIEVLSESLEDMLTQFQTANPTTGQVSDIDIAIIDFNGYYPSSKGSYDEISLPNGESRSNVDNAKVFTGTNAGSYIRNITLSADNFVSSTSLTPSTVAGNFNNNSCSSGTNYDGALENAYKLLSAKKTANLEAGVTRDQYVIFLSDGAPYRYNGFNNGGTHSTYPAWERWLTGYWDSESALLNTYNNLSYSYFYNGNGTTHPHRIAEAIKGDVNTKYDVVVREAANNEPAYIDKYPGLGATIYSIGFGLKDDGTAPTNVVTKNTMTELIRVISSGEGYHYDDVQTADELSDAFNQIITNISYAATNAYFTDEMGGAYDLQLGTTVKTSSKDDNGNIIPMDGVDTSITVTTYPIYTKAQVGKVVDGYTVKSDDVGKSYGPGNEVEKVTFNAAGDEATSTAKTEDDGNIINDGVICAKNFFYNTTTSVKTITLANGSTYQLPGETFYWNIGTINEQKFVLSYMVYLTGSMEGTRSEGESYPTNGDAILHYTNYLGNNVDKSVASPSMPWGGANVSYAFYLVDDEGNPLLADGTRAENFLVSYKVTEAVLYKTINLNSGATVLSTVGKDVLPDGYTLYDKNAVYTVTVNSGDGYSGWTITGDHPQSTYVTGYAGAQDYSNATPVTNESYDYTSTTVYFAVVWTIGTVPDTVVIDFGLPVDISVLKNDMFGNNGTLVGVGETAGTLDDKSGFGDSYTDTYGTATIDAPNGKVKYELSSMQINEPEQFQYAVDYNGTSNAGYYYGAVTVIPATTVYFEDEFVTLKTYTMDTDDTDGDGVTTDYNETSGWNTNSVAATATQAEDRPGKYSLSGIDANNVYGYDGAYSACSQYSMGSAAMTNVNTGKYATAEFEFYGTGFDVISLTDNTTGTIVIKVYDENNNEVLAETVNTYYDYEKDSDGKWVVTQNNPNALYQVPVMKIGDGKTTEVLDYGKYRVVITATYIPFLDHNETDNGYNFYLDAIRIYNPTGNMNTVANAAYVADGEGWPTYLELRDHVISKNTFDSTNSESVSGIVFIDGGIDEPAIADYTSYGPNNELYLAAGQAVAFKLDQDRLSNIADVQIALKVGNGGTVNYKIYNAETTMAADANEKTLNTATDMYYSIKDLASGTIVITNSGDSGILSITNIKFTYTQNPNGTSTADLLMDEEGAGIVLKSLRRMPVVEEDPEATKPEVTEPETTEPEETVPETTVPETTVPVETKPVVTPETVVSTVKNVVTTIVNALNNLLGRWFR